MELNGCYIITNERCKMKTKRIMFSLIRPQSNWRCTPVVCWLYSCAKVLQCKYNAQDNVDCDFLSSSACTVNLGPHILLWCVCPFCWLRRSYIAKSGGSISEHSQKHEKWFTMFWPTIRFIWFDCCYNMFDFQKCGVLCNQWEVPLQICVLQIDVSHPLFAQTFHQRSKLAKCTFSKIYLAMYLFFWTVLSMEASDIGPVIFGPWFVHAMHFLYIAHVSFGFYGTNKP